MTPWRSDPVEALRRTKEDTKLLCLFPIRGKNLLVFRTLGHMSLSRYKRCYRIFVKHFFSLLGRLFLCLTAVQLCCGWQCWGQCLCGFFCLELLCLNVKHLLKAFWIQFLLLLRQRICLDQSSESLFLSQQAVIWFTSSSYAPSLIVLAFAPI